MNIKQASELTGLSAKQIRDYEKVGLIKTPVRSQAGYRRYYEHDIHRLRFIGKARAVGFSLAQISDLLALQDSPNTNKCEVRALTAIHIQELTDKINQLDEMRATLQHWHNLCQDDMGDDCPILQGLSHL